MVLFENLVNESKLVKPLVDKLDPVINRIPEFLGRIEYFLGGMFGLYVIYFTLTLLKSRKEVKLLSEIKQELKEIKELKQKLVNNISKKKR